MKWMDFLLNHWFPNKFLCWGVGPVAVSNAAFFGSAAVLELLLASGLCNNCLIAYGAKSRPDSISSTRARISFFEQLRGCVWILCGPTVLLSMLVNAHLMHLLRPMSIPTEAPPAIVPFILQVLLMLIINDFVLYWGHRIQHMNEFLWRRCHWYHHQLDTPTAVSTVYIDSADAILQGGLPLILASCVIRAHPCVVYVFMFLRVADNAVNHCGMESPIVNFLFLKFLPFRAPVGHHDSHHRFSNYTKNAKNFGEYFWIWDYMFG